MHSGARNLKDVFFLEYSSTVFIPFSIITLQVFRYLKQDHVSHLVSDFFVGFFVVFCFCYLVFLGGGCFCFCFFAFGYPLLC